MQNKSILDSAITASSTLFPTTLYYAPGNARLHYKGETRRLGGWIPELSNHGQWLQINFGRVTQVTGIATQGFYNVLYYVKSYSLQYFDDRGFLQQYQPETHTKVSMLVLYKNKRLYFRVVLLAADSPCRRTPTVSLV